MKVLYIQHTGDFAEAYQRLYLDGGVENYYGQKYSVDAVVQQARSGIEVLIIVLKTRGFDRTLEANLRVVGLKKGKTDYAAVEREIEAFNPDRVILRTPDPRLLSSLRQRSVPTLPVFADSFDRKGFLRGRLYRHRIAKELKQGCIRWVGNHQMNASSSIQRLGVDPNKILPYDWEHSDTPANWSKLLPTNIDQKELQIFFAGKIIRVKGVFDVIKAVKCLTLAGRKVKAKIAGKGADLDELIGYAEKLGVADKVIFLGMTPHQYVLEHMNAADVVVVPSHHKYPEGLPMTIMESLMVHTPVIASDHPMFVGRVGSRGSVRFFREKSGEDLAQQILQLCHPETYKAACLHAPLEWNDCNLSLKWATLVNDWIKNPSSCDFSNNTLAALESAASIDKESAAIPARAFSSLESLPEEVAEEG